VTGYSGDAGNALMIVAPEYNLKSNGKMFSTPDSDDDDWVGDSCAAYESCGWWFAECSASNINKDTDGIWTTGSPFVFDVQASRMLVKLN